MPATEIHHQKEGVLASWGHACGHFSNPIWYESKDAAELERQRMESIPCWTCRSGSAPSSPQSPAHIEKWATFSDCRRYRYTLGRRWADGPTLVVIGHNPSTADETLDDPTIRRCIGFAKRDGFGAYVMVNLCAWRDTNPDGLTLLEDPVGLGNNAAILAEVQKAGRVVAAWGALHSRSKSQVVRERPLHVLRLVAPLVDVWAFRLTKAGLPEHPLYLPGDVQPVLYRAKASA